MVLVRTKRRIEAIHATSDPGSRNAGLDLKTVCSVPKIRTASLNQQSEPARGAAAMEDEAGADRDRGGRRWPRGIPPTADPATAPNTAGRARSTAGRALPGRRARRARRCRAGRSRRALRRRRRRARPPSPRRRRAPRSRAPSSSARSSRARLRNGQHSRSALTISSSRALVRASGLKRSRWRPATCSRRDQAGATYLRGGRQARLERVSVERAGDRRFGHGSVLRVGCAASVEPQPRFRSRRSIDGGSRAEHR